MSLGLRITDAAGIQMSGSLKLLRLVAALLAICIAVAAANYYMNLGWFGRYGRLVLSIIVLLTCILLVWSRRVSSRQL